MHLETIVNDQIDYTTELIIKGMITYSAEMLFPVPMDDLTIDLYIHDMGMDLHGMTDDISMNHHKIEIDASTHTRDSFDRILGTREMLFELCKTAAHEMVHVKQNIFDGGADRPISMKTGDAPTTSNEIYQYMMTPTEIEARGHEDGLLYGYLYVIKVAEEDDMLRKGIPESVLRLLT